MGVALVFLLLTLDILVVPLLLALNRYMSTRDKVFRFKFYCCGVEWIKSDLLYLYLGSTFGTNG